MKGAAFGTAWEKILIGSDIHAWFMDYRAWDIFLGIAGCQKWDRVILNGDTLDCANISQHADDIDLHNPDVLSSYSLEEEFGMAENHIFRKLRKAVGKNTKILNRLGNHEWRFIRPKKSNKSALGNILEFQNKKGKQKIHELLNLDKYDVDMSYNAKDKLYGTFTVVHGVKTTAYAARANLLKYMSGCSGHSHRMNKWTQRIGGHVQGWWESGCLRTVENIEYLPHGDEADWSQGFLTLYINRNSGRFFCTPHFIHPWGCEFNGILYK
jgi:hypothetical protein